MKVLSIRRTPMPQKRTPRKFIVELDEGELDFLLGVTGITGGDPVHSPRKYAARIGEKLKKVAGYTFWQTDTYRLLDDDAGADNTIVFRNYDGTQASAYRQRTIMSDLDLEPADTSFGAPGRIIEFFPGSSMYVSRN